MNYEERRLNEEYELRKRYCWSYQHINLDLSDPSKFPKRQFTPKRAHYERAGFCPECGGFMYIDFNEVDLVCEACGLIDEDTVMVCDYEERVKRAQDEMKIHTTHIHKPSVKQELNSSKIDQRVESIVLSLDNRDKIAESIGGQYIIKIPKLLALYNNDLDNNDLMNYTPITRFQLRESYNNRIWKRKDAKIDRLIENMLFKALNPTDDKIINAMIQSDPVATETIYPWLFLYEGTERIKLQDHRDYKEHAQFQEKLRKRRRAEQVKRVQERPLSPIVIHRTYKVGNENKTITFTLMYNRIYFSGDELNNRFENFFLSEAFNRGCLGKMPQCPGTKDICPRYVERAKEAFLLRFRRLGGFIKAPFYDPAPYLQQNGMEKTV